LIIAMPLRRAGSVRQPPDGRPAGVGEPVVVDAKDRRHQRRVRHLEVKEPLRGIEDFTGHPIERHVLEVLLGVVPAAVHVFKAPLGGDRLGGLEPRAGIRDEADPGEDLIRLDDNVVAAADPLYPRRTIPERPIDAGLPQIGRFEHVRVRRENQGQHRHLLSHLIPGNTFGNRPIAVKAGAAGDPCPAAVKIGLGSTRAEPRRRANGRNRHDLAAGTSFSASYGS
jgi:hypothetical protein